MHVWAVCRQFVIFHIIVVEIAVKFLRSGKPAPHQLVAGFCVKSQHGILQGAMATVRPAALLGHRHHRVRRSAPQFFGALQQVSSSKFTVRISQKTLRRLAVLFCQH